SVRARVVAEIDQEPEGFLYAIHLLEPRSDFWDIEFPHPVKAEEALARLLMECSFCQRREVVYLNELELKSFEIRKAIARVCKICDAPSIWSEVQSELTPEAILSARQSLEERVVPRRNRTRVKARVLACIRRRGFQEEVAVCEDLSKGGLAFRSRNEYPEGSRLEVAVPYTPGTGAIFVPIRIVFSQPIASAGLFRHGAAYLRPPE
ncbi:MAG TPA: PilZ domain-containing protein, partial [Candidatus Acidoferrum sp.]|nr:PilZ domain-containing protein [Candidatus Acidoferrum sp.]